MSKICNVHLGHRHACWSSFMGFYSYSWIFHFAFSKQKQKGLNIETAFNRIFSQQNMHNLDGNFEQSSLYMLLCFFSVIYHFLYITSYAGAQTAWDMLHEEDLSRHITTSCADLDNILGGGIHCKEVTEIG